MVAITSPVHPFTVADDKYIVVMGNCQQPCLSIGAFCIRHRSMDRDNHLLTIHGAYIFIFGHTLYTHKR